MMRKFTIGRERTCDFPVADESVSRLHAEIWLTDDGTLMIGDRGSSNGTALMRNGQSIPVKQDLLMMLSDDIRFGASQLRVKDLVDAIELKNPGALTPKAPPKAAPPPPLPPPPPKPAAPAPPAPAPAAPPPAPVAAPPPPPKPAPPPPPPPPAAAPTPPAAAAPAPHVAPPVPAPAPAPHPAPAAAPPPPPPPPPNPAAGPVPPPPPVPPAAAQPQAGAAHPAPAPLLPAAPPPGKVDPVVGWLVCLDGPDRGHDYPLRAGENTLGRSPSMDVCIANDAAVSRERHLIVTFDSVKETFLLLPGESAGLLYLNGESIRSPRHVKRDDVIEVGRTKLVFIPFCDGKYHWGA